MKSTVPNTDDTIEVLPVPGAPYIRIRIREHGFSFSLKASVLLGPDQLEEHAEECKKAARALREHGAILQCPK